MGSSLFFWIWLCRIFWFIRFTTIQTWNHVIPAKPLNFLDIQTPQTTRFNIKYVRPLLLPLRTPQNQVTVLDVIIEHVYICSLQVQWYKCCAGVPRSVWRVTRLQPLGASAAVVQISSIIKGTYTNYCQSKMSLLVNDFTYLEGKDCELVVKELAAVDSHRSRVSSYVFKRPYS